LLLQQLLQAGCHQLLRLRHPSCAAQPKRHVDSCGTSSGSKRTCSSESSNEAMRRRNLVPWPEHRHREAAADAFQYAVQTSSHMKQWAAQQAKLNCVVVMPTAAATTPLKD
jgi:hypothetical protein